MKKMLVTEQDKELIRNIMLEQIEKSLGALHSPDKQISISYDLNLLCKSALPNLQPAPFIYFTPLAWVKMNELVSEYTTEVAAHGTVERTEDGDYIVTDILVYPQTITNATVESIDEEYGPWICKQGRGVINKLRFQFHSHVNFGATPSARDLQYYADMTSQFEDYYIFMILNKKGENHIIVYDKAQGVIYEDKDLSYGIITGEDEVLQEWLDASAENTHKPAPVVTPAAAVYSTPPLYTPPAYVPPVTPPAPNYGAFASSAQAYRDELDDFKYRRESRFTDLNRDLPPVKRGPGRPKKEPVLKPKGRVK